MIKKIDLIKSTPTPSETARFTTEPIRRLVKHGCDNISGYTLEHFWDAAGPADFGLRFAVDRR